MYWLLQLLQLVTIWWFQEAIHAQELIANPDFENPFGSDNWVCTSCALTQTDQDAYSGTYSGYVTDRTDTWAGVSQYVSLAPNSHYHFTIHVKLLTQANAWDQVNLLAALESGGTFEYVNIGEHPQLMASDGWVKLGGDFYLGGTAYDSIRLYVQVEDPSVDYLADLASLTAFSLSPNWKEEAEQRIADIRMSDVTINLEITGGYDPASINVQLTQISHAFPFGSAIVDAEIAGDSEYNGKYQDTFYGNFNWAVMENGMKWQTMEPVQYSINFPDESVRRLNERGIPLRSHCMYWGVEQFVPEWLRSFTGEDIYTEITRRNQYMVDAYADSVIHWDVNNEQLHGQFFEEASGNPWILAEMFNMLTELDPDSLLYLNDYDIVSSSRMTQAYVHSLNRIEYGGAQVAGLGVQSHLVGYPDLAAIQKRLDVASSQGTMLLITELDVEIEDRETRANAYDDVTTLYFAHPNVEGILLWGFSDNHHWRPMAALFEGDDFVANAAGLRWQEMIFSRWRTSASFTPSSSSDTFGTRGFHGRYSVEVTHNGESIHTEEFDLGVEGSTIDINV